MLPWWWRYKVETCSYNRKCKRFIVSTVLFHLSAENWTVYKRRSDTARSILRYRGRIMKDRKAVCDSVLTFRTPGPFLPAILQRTIGSGWNLLKEALPVSCRYCARIICRGRNRWLLSGTRFQRAGQWSFEARIISKNLWPPRSPDLTCPFFPLGDTWSTVQE